MEIRHIQKDDDRSAISRIYEESWKFAYRGIVPQEYLDSIPEGRWASSFCVYLGRTDDRNVSSTVAKEIAIRIVEDYYK